MINLPLTKWTLNFHNSEHEALYQESQNQFKIITFRVTNILMALAGFLGLIIFLVQEQPYYLIIIISGPVVGCVSLFLMSSKLIPHMKQMFSFLYIWSFFTNVIICYSGFQIPNFIIGFNAGCLSVGALHYSDNRLKIIYLVLTPFILFGVFEAYSLDNLSHFFQTICAISFICILTYQNEYTSRMAFSLKVITQKQKDIINEFVNDSMFAISFIEQTGQFELEFSNNECQKNHHIKETEEMKRFIRTSHCTQKEKCNENVKRPIDSQANNKQTLEQFFCKIIKQQLSIHDSHGNLPEFDLINEKELTQSWQIRLKLINSMKPLLLIIIKQNNEHLQSDLNSTKVATYSKALLNQSKELAEQNVKIYKRFNSIKVTSEYENRFSQIKCLHLQMINRTRNYIIHQQKQNIYQSLKYFDVCNLKDYLRAIEYYCFYLSKSFHVRFEIINFIDSNFVIKLNTKFLTQIILNIFEDIIQKAQSGSIITLQVQEKFEDDIVDAKKNTLISNHSGDKSLNEVFQKLLQFSFFFKSYPDQDQFTFKAQRQIENNIEDENNNIFQNVTNFLLDLLGPYNTTFQKYLEVNQLNKKQENILQFYIYIDQSLLDISYYKKFQALSESW